MTSVSKKSKGKATENGKSKFAFSSLLLRLLFVCLFVCVLELFSCLSFIDIA